MAFNSLLSPQALSSPNFSSQPGPCICDGNALLDAQLFEHQIGGRNHRKQAKITAFLQHNEFVLKPRAPGSRGDNELSYYRLMNFCNQNDLIENKVLPVEMIGSVPVCKELACFVPRFHGTVFCHKDGHCVEYLKLSNLCNAYRKPCVADIKIGTQTFDENAPLEKKQMELSKFPNQKLLGFRFTGMKVYDPQLQAYSEFDKSYCHSLTLDNYIDGFKNYFKKCPKFVIELFISKLEELARVFSVNQHRFIASSLLFIYEGEINNLDNADNCDSYLPSLYLIDFGHVTPLPSNKVDEGVLHGIHSIINTFKNLTASL